MSPMSSAETRIGAVLRRLLLVATASLAFATPDLAHGEDWTGIRESYDQLKRYMSAKRRIGPDEKTSLTALQGRIDRFREANPEDPRPLALDIQVSTWLGDDDRIDADYEALATLSELDRIQVAEAKHRLGMNRYGSIPTILEPPRPRRNSGDDNDDQRRHECHALLRFSRIVHTDMEEECECEYAAAVTVKAEGRRRNRLCGNVMMRQGK